MLYKTGILLGIALTVTTALAQNIVISDDDGWATAQIRAQYESLSSAGYNVRPGLHVATYEPPMNGGHSR